MDRKPTKFSRYIYFLVKSLTIKRVHHNQGYLPLCFLVPVQKRDPLPQFTEVVDRLEGTNTDNSLVVYSELTKPTNALQKEALALIQANGLGHSITLVLGSRRHPALLTMKRYS